MSRPKRLLVTLVAGVFALLGLATASAESSAEPLSTSELSVLREMNSVRQSNGLRGLRVDRRLELVARAHSRDMLQRQYFAHTLFASRIRASGARGPLFGENLAWGPSSARWVVTQWLASAHHRANLLRPGFQRVGVGAATGTYDGQAGTLMVTADFAGR
jgi:uncharacterized protein YkwD